MIVSHLIDGAVLIVLAYIGARQEKTRRDLKQFNGTVEHKLDAIHRNLIDNPGPPSLPPMGEFQTGGKPASDDPPPQSLKIT